MMRIGDDGASCYIKFSGMEYFHNTRISVCRLLLICYNVRCVYFQATKYNQKMKRLNVQLEKNLQEGVLQEDFILDNIQKLMNIMREGNVTLRWLLLHTAALPTCKHFQIYNTYFFFSSNFKNTHFTK